MFLTGISLSQVEVLAPLALAVVIDLTFGDPPNRFHPVAWIGSLLLAARRKLPTQGRLVPLACGTFLMVNGLAGAVGLGLAIERGLALAPHWLAIVFEAALLKSLYSIRGLARAALEVARALERGDLPQARKLAAWHLVSRRTEELDHSLVAAAAIESVSENSSDSVVAPLLYYALGGLPGALAYRVINTADSIFGYRDQEREWLGKVPARLDDLANLVPARLTALAITLSAPLVGGSPCQALRTWWRDASQTASPNAGHPMSAAAGSLGVVLEKPGAYRLGSTLRNPLAEDIQRSVRLMFGTISLALVPLCALRWLLH